MNTALFKKLTSEAFGKFYHKKYCTGMPNTSKVFSQLPKEESGKNWFKSVGTWEKSNWYKPAGIWERFLHGIVSVMAVVTLGNKQISGFLGEKSEIELLSLEMKKIEQSMAESMADEFKALKEQNLRLHGELLEAIRSNSWPSWLHGLVLRLSRSFSSHEVNSGKVVAVGPPGCHDSEGKLIPVTVKQGDTVLLPEHGGTEVKLGEKEYHMFRGDDILGPLMFSP